MNQFEKRDSLDGTVELRSSEGAGLGTLVGYAAVWKSESRNLGGFTEQVMPGAFSKTLQEKDIRALVNHDQALILGRLGAGTLRLEEDERGLRYEIDLPNTSAGRDAAESVDRGDIVGSSFKFAAVKQSWDRDAERSMPLRSLHEVALADVGPVTYPAYEATEGAVALRSLAEDAELDPDAVLAAAEAGELRTLLSADEAETSDEKPVEEPVDETTPKRRPIGRYVG